MRTILLVVFLVAYCSALSEWGKSSFVPLSINLFSPGDATWLAPSMCPDGSAVVKFALKVANQGESQDFVGVSIFCSFYTSREREERVDAWLPVLNQTLLDFQYPETGCELQKDNFINGIRIFSFVANKTVYPYSFAGYCSNEKIWTLQSRNWPVFELKTSANLYCPSNWDIAGVQIQSTNFSAFPANRGTSIGGLRFLCRPRLDVCGGCYDGSCSPISKVCSCSSSNWRGPQCQENRLIYPAFGFPKVRAETDDGIVEGATLRCDASVVTPSGQQKQIIDPTRTTVYWELSNGRKIISKTLDSAYVKGGISVRCGVSLCEDKTYSPCSDVSYSEWVLITGMVRQPGYARDGWDHFDDPATGVVYYLSQFRVPTIVEGMKHCRAIGKDPLVITSTKMNEGVANMLSRSPFDRAFFGVLQNQYHEVLYTSSFIPAYTSPSVFRATNTQNLTCYSIVKDGSWTTGACDPSPVLCYQAKHTGQILTAFVLGGTKQSWSEAESYCETSWGGNLVVSSNPAAQTQLHSDLNTLSPTPSSLPCKATTWVGFNSKIQSVWTDGAPMNDPVSSKLTSDMSCLIQQGSQLAAVPCSNTYCFFCNAQILTIVPGYSNMTISRHPRFSKALMASMYVEISNGNVKERVDGERLPYQILDLQPGEARSFKVFTKERTSGTVGIVDGAPVIGNLFNNAFTSLSVTTSCDCGDQPWGNGAPSDLSYIQKAGFFVVDFVDNSACEVNYFVSTNIETKTPITIPATKLNSTCFDKARIQVPTFGTPPGTQLCIQAMDSKRSYLSPLIQTSCIPIEAHFYTKVTGRVVSFQDTSKPVQRVVIEWMVAEFPAVHGEVVVDVNGKFTVHIDAITIPLNASVTVQVTPRRETAGYQHLFEPVTPFPVQAFQEKDILILDQTKLQLLTGRVTYGSITDFSCPAAETSVCIRGASSSSEYCVLTSLNGQFTQEVVFNQTAVLYSLVHVLGTSYASRPVTCGTGAVSRQNLGNGTASVCLVSNVQNDISSINYAVDVTFPVSVTVAGGSTLCNIELGNAVLAISSRSGCGYTRQYTTSGSDTITFNLPPAVWDIKFKEFEIQVGMDPGLAEQRLLASRYITDRYGGVGTRVINLRTETPAIRFEYRAKPVASLLDIDGGKQCGGTWQVYGGEGISQPHILKFSISEDYGQLGQCHYSGNVFVGDFVTDKLVGNAIAAYAKQSGNDLPTQSCYSKTLCSTPLPEATSTTRQASLFEWTIIPGTPNPTGEFTKRFVLNVPYNRSIVPFEFYMIVVGKLPQDNTYSSVLTPKQMSFRIPDLILYDPPGSGSSSSIKAGYKVENTVTTKFTGTSSTEFSFQFGFGLKLSASICTCGVVTLKCEDLFDIDEFVGIKTKITLEIETSNEKTHSYSYNVERRLSTSTSPGQINGLGDLIVVNTFLWQYITIKEVVTADIGGKCTPVVKERQVWDSSIDSISYLSVADITNNVRLIQKAIATESENPDPKRKQSLIQSLDSWNGILKYWAASREPASFASSRRMSSYLRSLGVPLDDPNNKFGVSNMVSDTYFFSGGQESSFKVTSTSKRTALTGYGFTISGSLSFGFELTAVIFQMKLGISQKLALAGQFNDETAIENTKEVSWVFSDKDLGDEFGVEVWINTDYGTPIFKTINGRSSCPWEAGTLTRNAPGMEISTSVISNADPDVPATLMLTLLNAGDTADTERTEWAYTLSSYNPQGLDIRVAGQLLSETKYYLSKEPQTVTVELSKNFGYEYNDNYLILAPSCESGLEVTVPFSVSFLHECAPMIWTGTWRENLISNYFTINGQVVSPDDFEIRNDDALPPSKDLLQIVVQNVKFPETLWSDNPRLIEVVVEYKHSLDTDWSVAELAGDGGPAKLVEGGYGFAQAVINTTLWKEEGTYSIRARATCLSETGHERSKFLTSTTDPRSGIVDRTKPFVLRELAQPADESFWPGDEIKVRYSEPLNCFLFATPLKASITIVDDEEEPSSMADGFLDVICNEDTLYFAFGHLFRYSEAKGKTVRMAVSGAADKAGNIQEEEFTWQFAIEPTEPSALSVAVSGYVLPTTIDQYIADWEAKVHNSHPEGKRFMDQTDDEEIIPAPSNMTQSSPTLKSKFIKYFVQDLLVIIRARDGIRIKVDQIVEKNASLLLDLTFGPGSPDASVLYQRLLDYDLAYRNTNKTKRASSTANSTGLSKASYAVGTTQAESKSEDKWGIYWKAVSYDTLEFLFVMGLFALVPLLAAYVVYLFTAPKNKKDEEDEGYHRL